MVDFNLSEEQRHWQQVARRFATESIAPVVADYDSRSDPLDRMPWPLVREASTLGLRTLSVPKELGGAGADWFTLCLVAEEIGTADIGFATTLEICWMYTPVLVRLMTPEQKEKFLRPFVTNPIALLAPASTEPDTGSDANLPYSGPSLGYQTRAERRGEGWVINGTKLFTSSGGCATLYMLSARTDFSKPIATGTTVFLVPAETPGLRITQVMEKFAHRLNPQTVEVFENCYVPDDHRIGPLNEGTRARRDLSQRAVCVGAASLLGPGRAAFEASIAFAKSQVVGGKPLVQQQAVAMMLADMALQIDAARLLIWNSAWASDRGQFPDPALPYKAKVMSSEVAFAVAQHAVELFGERGILTEYPIERYLREATGGLHHFGTNQVLRLKIAAPLGHDFNQP